eukprot:m.288823 g.288823  ORF g.288823 m.288823 type:complete len:86 (+) comp16371_c1_seq29:4871-5128(+)
MRANSADSSGHSLAPLVQSCLVFWVFWLMCASTPFHCVVRIVSRHFFSKKNFDKFDPAALKHIGDARRLSQQVYELPSTRSGSVL